MVDLYEENRPWFEAKFVEMVQDVNGGLTVTTSPGDDDLAALNAGSPLDSVEIYA